jgi:hypothetical protein
LVRLGKRLLMTQQITTPANWQPGEKVIVHPSVQGEKVKELFGDKVETVYVGCAVLLDSLFQVSRFRSLRHVGFTLAAPVSSPLPSAFSHFMILLRVRSASILLPHPHSITPYSLTPSVLHNPSPP